MRRIVLGLSVLALAALAPAAADAAGMSLRWDKCYSDGGVVNRTFACDTNTGAERLVMSFVLDNPVADLSGVEIRMIIVPASPTLPSWWQMKNVGTCRPTSLTMNLVLPPGSVNCVNWGNEAAMAGGIGAYTVSSQPGPNTAVVQMIGAVPASDLATIEAGQEYFAGTLVINHAKSVGVGACAGCDVPTCIVVDRMRLTTPVFGNDVTLLDPAFGSDSNFARWQNGQETNVQLVNCEGHNFGCYHSFSCELSSTPTRNATWGAVKSLYR
jgi:hypothetical protein